MITLLIYHEAKNHNIYIQRIYDGETGAILSEWNEEEKKIDFTPLWDYIGQTILLKHIVIQENGELEEQKEATNKVRLDNIDTEDNQRYIAYTILDDEVQQ